MANRNGQGPEGKGPRTGRGQGDCEPQTDTERTSGYTRRGQGGGRRRENGPDGRGLNRRGR